MTAQLRRQNNRKLSEKSDSSRSHSFGSNSSSNSILGKTKQVPALHAPFKQVNTQIQDLKNHCSLFNIPIPIGANQPNNRQNSTIQLSMLGDSARSMLANQKKEALVKLHQFQSNRSMGGFLHVDKNFPEPLPFQDRLMVTRQIVPRGPSATSLFSINASPSRGRTPSRKDSMEFTRQSLGIA